MQAARLNSLLDGQTCGAIEDRYVFQPAILRAFGWKVIDIPSHSWLRDPAAVVTQIEHALHRDHDTDDDPFEGQASPQPRAVAPDPVAEPGHEPPSDGTLQFSSFRFQQGNSDKFWKIAVSGIEVIVMFGRFGTKGSTVMKQFESPERAQREAAKLIAEKVRKGYVEE